MYSVRGRTVATAATGDHAVFAVWNPHSTQRIKVISIGMFAQTAGTAGWTGRIRRITTRGTPASTVTPGITNHHDNAVAPVSGVLLDLANYSVQPTLTGIDLLIGYPFPAVIGAGIQLPIAGGLVVGPGLGIAFVQVPATASAVFEIAVSWLEDWM